MKPTTLPGAEANPQAGSQFPDFVAPADPPGPVDLSEIIPVLPLAENANTAAFGGEDSPPAEVDFFDDIF